MEEAKGQPIVTIREMSSLSDTSTTMGSPPSTSPSAPASTASSNPSLQQFQISVGIRSTPIDKKLLTRPGPNIGIYQQIIRSERWLMVQYYTCSTLLQSCILLQIVFAATLTALGASASPPLLITIFGAINTCLAGILALMKGQGLPMRLRRDWMELRRVRDFIEERERCFEDGLYTVDGMRAQVDEIYRMYERARQVAEDNRADTYVGSDKAGDKGVGSGSGSGSGSGAGTGKGTEKGTGTGEGAS